MNMYQKASQEQNKNKDDVVDAEVVDEEER